MSDEQHDSGGGASWEDHVAAMPLSLTAEEAAIVLRLHPTNVRRLAVNGEILAEKIGQGRGVWRFNKAQLLARLGIDSREFGVTDSIAAAAEAAEAQRKADAGE